MAHLLVVDDEESICWGLSQLGRRMGHTVAVAASAEEALGLIAAQRPDAIVLDVRLPGMDGLSALTEFRRRLGPVAVIVITAYGELATAVAAVRSGAFDYLVKPFDLAVAERAIRRALESRETSGEAPAALPEDPTEQIAGASPAIQEVFKRIALVAPCDACVHLCGESGTGKELVARAVHRYSRRASGPFVAVNAASLTPSLAESELFGHARGSFTGADQPHQGLLERADGGTLFFDEVADIPLALQVKLLRVLEFGEVLPVGADRTVRADFRVISATHQDLRRRVAEGAFRHDLYFRLVTFEIAIPPLRERREDIRVLAELFLDQLAVKNGTPRPELAAEAVAELQGRPWYGNARELRNAMEHAFILARGARITPELLPPAAAPLVAPEAGQEEQIALLIQRWARAALQRPEGAGDLYEHLLRLVEPPLLAAVMEHSRGQCASAARQLGLHRTTLRKKLDQFGIAGQ